EATRQNCGVLPETAFRGCERNRPWRLSTARRGSNNTTCRNQAITLKTPAKAGNCALLQLGSKIGHLNESISGRKASKANCVDRSYGAGGGNRTRMPMVRKKVSSFLPIRPAHCDDA